MAAYITEHCREPLSVGDLARRVGLHPNTATTLFRRLLGTGVVEYLTQYRIAHAQRLPMTDPPPVLAVMHEVGFRSTSRFHEVFRRACDRSPGKFRRQFTG
ncbi:helix-turn-helix transcriptional regulator [Deinococcus sp.]|uniref:helix-turn-helix transcriptional regulator n=1 Tax=Deinococcus sp. TaxID=47478 RepID=UPI003C7C3DD3